MTLEVIARYAGQLLSPVEGSSLQPRICPLLGNQGAFLSNPILVFNSNLINYVKKKIYIYINIYIYLFMHKGAITFHDFILGSKTNQIYVKVRNQIILWC